MGDRSPLVIFLLVSLIMLLSVPPHRRGNYVFQRISPPSGQNPKYVTDVVLYLYLKILNPISTIRFGKHFTTIIINYLLVIVQFDAICFKRGRRLD